MCEYPEKKRDGICTDENNNYKCDYDGGDCCFPDPNPNPNWNETCTHCKCLEGVCQPIAG